MFLEATSPIGSQRCMNVERLIDIQPDGDANFCVDFPDNLIGSVQEATIEEIWNGNRANRFRAVQRENPLRCTTTAGRSKCRRSKSEVSSA